MNNRYLAALGAALLLALPLSAQAEATAAEAAWTPPVVTAEEMDAAHLGERILMRGLEGDDVRLMQQRLYDLGYLDGDVDGKFGLQTQKAVRAFQRAHKLEKIDGKVGEQTLAALFGDDVIALPTPTPSSTPSPTPTSVPTATPVPIWSMRRSRCARWISASTGRISVWPSARPRRARRCIRSSG